MPSYVWDKAALYHRTKELNYLHRVHSLAHLQPLLKECTCSHALVARPDRTGVQLGVSSSEGLRMLLHKAGTPVGAAGGGRRSNNSPA